MYTRVIQYIRNLYSRLRMRFCGKSVGYSFTYKTEVDQPGSNDLFLQMLAIIYEQNLAMREDIQFLQNMNSKKKKRRKRKKK